MRKTAVTNENEGNDFRKIIRKLSHYFYRSPHQFFCIKRRNHSRNLLKLVHVLDRI